MVTVCYQRKEMCWLSRLLTPWCYKLCLLIFTAEDEVEPAVSWFAPHQKEEASQCELTQHRNAESTSCLSLYWLPLNAATQALHVLLEDMRADAGRLSKSQIIPCTIEEWNTHIKHTVPCLPEALATREWNSLMPPVVRLRATEGAWLALIPKPTPVFNSKREERHNIEMSREPMVLVQCVFSFL